MDIANRLKKLRQSVGLSAKRLAEMSNLVPSQIVKIEGGNAKPSIDSLERICSALSVSLSEFFAEEVQQQKFSREEEKTIYKIRKLTGSQQKAVNAVIDEMLPPFSMYQGSFKNRRVFLFIGNKNYGKEFYDSLCKEHKFVENLYHDYNISSEDISVLALAGSYVELSLVAPFHHWEVIDYSSELGKYLNSLHISENQIAVYIKGKVI